MSRWAHVILISALAAGGAAGAEFPEAVISNGILRAKLYLPDPQKGYYQGTRFDWSGVIPSLQFDGHEYFGQWFEKYDPKIHDAIMGPVEEFRTNDAGLGYDEAKAGETFIRIGVGVVRKPEERAYQAFRTYDIVDPGKWKIRKSAGSVEFTHTLKGPNGYAYVYSKTVRLVGGKPEMVLEHSLRNTGNKVIDTAVYDHNFFVIDRQPTGPAHVIVFGFDPRPKADFRGRAEIKGRELVYTKELEGRQSVFSEIEGFSGEVKDYDFRIEDRKAGAGVRITADQPLAKVVFWSIRPVACPEPYIHMRIEPGKTSRWNIRYQFYNVPATANH